MKISNHIVAKIMTQLIEIMIPVTRTDFPLLGIALIEISFQGTMGCTPNSVPMVFIVFSRDSWG